MLQGKICMHFLWNKGLSRISEIIVMIRITTTENRQNIFYKMSVLHPSKRQQLEMTFYLFNASTLTLLWRTDCNEVSNTSVGHHFLTLIGIFIIFIAVVFKHPNMNICANARYTEWQENPYCKDFICSIWREEPKMTENTVKGAWNSIKSAVLWEKQLLVFSNGS